MKWNAMSRWFTNMDHNRRHKPLILRETYSSEKYPRYINHDAIHVKRNAEIPADWSGAMGVPLSILDKHCPEQFEILGLADRGKDVALLPGPNGTQKRVFTRVLIRNHNPEPTRSAA